MVLEWVVDVEVRHNKVGELKIGEKNFWWHGVNPVVSSIGGVSVHNPKGVEGGAKKRFIGGDVEGEDIIHLLEPGEHRVIGNERHMDVVSHTWLPNRGKKDLKPLKEGS